MAGDTAIVWAVMVQLITCVFVTRVFVGHIQSSFDHSKCRLGVETTLQLQHTVCIETSVDWGLSSAELEKARLKYYSNSSPDGRGCRIMCELTWR